MTLSLNFRKAANAAQTGEIPVVLVTVAHDLLDEPMRFSSDPTQRLSTDPLRYGTVSRGHSFDYLPMQMTPPEDGDDNTPSIELIVTSLTKQLTPLLRSTQTPARVTTEIVLASSPDNVEGAWPDFDLVNANGAGSDVTMTLSVEALSTEPYPAGLFSPGNFPGLF